MTPPTNGPVVIGAGPAGLAAAARLVELGVTPTVVEASDRVGGMAGSLRLWGHSVDLGPHRFFSADPVVTAFWHRYVADDFVMVPRQTRIYYHGRFFTYPLNAQNAIVNLGLPRATMAVASYARGKLRPAEEDGSLETWVSNRFGRVLYETFFRAYTEKLWGVSCTELDADWAAQRIQGLTLWGAVRNAILGSRRPQEKTLVDEFAYPTTGNQLFYDRLAESIERGGGHVRLNSPVRQIEVSGQRATGVVLASGESLQTDWIVSSMPITHLLRGLPDVPQEVQSAAGALRFRNTVLVYLLIDRSEVFPDQWLYIHDPRLRHGRVTNFHNWSPALVGPDDRTVLCLEFWCFDDDDIWSQTEDSLVALATDEIVATGLVERDHVLEGAMVRIPRCYPVYQRGYQQPLSVVTDFLDTIDGLTPIGRYGAFKYNNQDHSILMGILAAEAVANNRRPHLWDINTDSVYQESGSSRPVARRS